MEVLRVGRRIGRTTGVYINIKEKLREHLFFEKKFIYFMRMCFVYLSVFVYQMHLEPQLLSTTKPSFFRFLKYGLVYYVALAVVELVM